MLNKNIDKQIYENIFTQNILNTLKNLANSSFNNHVIPFPKIRQRFATSFALSRQQTKIVLKFLQLKGYIEIKKRGVVLIGG